MNDNKALDRAKIIAALRAECTECSEQHWCKGGINGVGLYCPIQDAAALLELAAEPQNEPLTLEELRGVDGEPVYIVEHPDWGHWELSECAEDYFDDRDEDFYGMTMPPTLPDPMGRYGLHVLGWLAYRRKPDGGEM